jgi:hypothetical protein
VSADLRAQGTASAMLQRRGVTLSLSRDGVAYTMRGVVLPSSPRGPDAGSLTVQESVTAYLTPVGASRVPQAGDGLTWLGREFTLRRVETLAPTGTVPVLYTAEATR